MTTDRRTVRLGAMLGGLVLAAGLLAGPAHAKPDHERSKTKPGGHTVTEDNDDDGVPNNVADEGDNAHPSGKDRSVEHGGSGNQGKSESNPDGGEVDKPGGRGGVDVEDQDGNNGCGNDDDFEDDNNGNCGGRKKGHGKVRPPLDRTDEETDRGTGGATDEATDEPATGGDDVRRTRARTTADAKVPGATDVQRVIKAPLVEGPEGARVLGVQFTRDVAASTVGALAEQASPPGGSPGLLARTGLDVAALVMAGLAALAAGAWMLRRSRQATDLAG